MNKILLFVGAISLAISVNAQNNTGINNDLPDAVRYKKVMATKKQFVGDEMLQMGAPKGLSSVSSSAVISEEVVGESTYDLQTNGSIQRRLVNAGSGKYTAAWTYGTDLAGAWPLRGTGYNYNNGSVWGAAPTARVETRRTGWPELDLLAGGKEILISHGNNDDALVMNVRSTIGSGLWQETVLTDLQPIGLWPRFAVGGANGTTVHVIGLTVPTAFGGTTYSGMDGALLYARSTDGGLNWDVLPMQIPGMDITNYDDIGGDGYAIDVKGDIVTIAVAETGQSVFMWKSEDNGDTWNQYTVLNTGLGKFSESVPVFDTIPTSGGSINVLIDNTNKVHVFYDKIRFFNQVPNDDQFSVFPSWYSSLGYWNEDMEEGQEAFLGTILDSDGQPGFSHGTYELVRYANTANFVSFPHSGIDANGNIQLIYTAVTEFNDGASHYRHIYGMMSEDNGCSWNFPTDLTPGFLDGGTHDFDECAFGSIARDTDSDAIRFLYQLDSKPGVSLANTPPSPVGNQEMVFAEVPMADLEVDKVWCFTSLEGEPEFCAGDSALLTASCGESYLWSTGETTQSIYADQYQTYSVIITTSCAAPFDKDTLEITTSAPSAGPVFNLSTNVANLCNGDTAMLSSTSVSNGVFLWSTGDTTQSIEVYAPGTYTVTVSNCGGSSNDGMTINLPPVPNANILGKLTACVGGSTQVFAENEQGHPTYLWNDGDVTKFNYGMIGDTLSVVVTNCAGTDSTGVVIAQTPAPTIELDTAGGDAMVCEGGIVNINASGAATYLWNDGINTNPIIVICQTSASGTYFVTGWNECGDSAVSDSIEVQIYARSAAPTVTYNSATVAFNSDATGVHNWFKGGVQVPNESSPSYAPLSWQFIVGQPIQASYIDGNGCESDTSVAVIGITTGLTENTPNTSVSIYPNPNNGVFQVKLMTGVRGSFDLSINNALGQKVFSQLVTVSDETILNLDLSQYGSGLYLVNLVNQNESINLKLMVK